MTGILQPLAEQFAIVTDEGKPTPYFIKWAQQKQIDITNGLSEAAMIAYFADHPLIAGSGIGLSPSGNISDGVTISAIASTILDQISSTRGTMLYRGASGWSALSPSTAGDILKTGGTGADPSWETVAAALDTISSTQGVLLYRGASGWVALGTGTSGSVLKTNGASADPAWATLSALLDQISSTQGAVLYRDSSSWAALGAGTAGQVLTSGGSGANPSWAAGGGGGSSHPWYWNPPAASIYSQVTSGGSANMTLTDNTDAGLLVDAGTPNTWEKFAYRTLTTKANDWVMTAKFKWGMPAMGNMRLGLSMMDSIGGRLQNFGVSDNVSFAVNNHSALAAYSSTPQGKAVIVGANTVEWLRMEKTGTTINYYSSSEGKQWSKFYTTTATTWLANNPDRVGFYVYNNHTTTGNTMFAIEYWSLTGSAV